jgi:hypothetical protein
MAAIADSATLTVSGHAASSSTVPGDVLMLHLKALNNAIDTRRVVFVELRVLSVDLRTTQILDDPAGRVSQSQAAVLGVHLQLLVIYL